MKKDKSHSSETLGSNRASKQNKLSVKAMESLLGVQHPAQTSVTPEAVSQKKLNHQFFKTREEFYEQNQRYCYVLENDLTRYNQQNRFIN